MFQVLLRRPTLSSKTKQVASGPSPPARTSPVPTRARALVLEHIYSSLDAALNEVSAPLVCACVPGVHGSKNEVDTAVVSGGADRRYTETK